MSHRLASGGWCAGVSLITQRRCSSKKSGPVERREGVRGWHSINDRRRRSLRRAIDLQPARVVSHGIERWWETHRCDPRRILVGVHQQYDAAMAAGQCLRFDEKLIVASVDAAPVNHHHAEVRASKPGVRYGCLSDNRGNAAVYTSPAQAAQLCRVTGLEGASEGDRCGLLVPELVIAKPVPASDADRYDPREQIRGRRHRATRANNGSRLGTTPSTRLKTGAIARMAIARVSVPAIVNAGLLRRRHGATLSNRPKIASLPLRTGILVTKGSLQKMSVRHKVYGTSRLSWVHDSWSS